MKEQNRITEAASENRKRGRPPIDIGTTSCLDGTRVHRSMQSICLRQSI